MHQDFAEVLIFEVDGKRLGLPIAEVEELHAAMEIAPIPGAKVPVEGLINLRGKLVPVINVRRCLGMPAKAVALTDHFIIARSGKRIFALHVDHALELIQLPAPALAEAPELNTSAVQLDDGLVLVHSLRHLLRGVDADALLAQEGQAS